MVVSKSRKVNAYVTAVRRLRMLTERLATQEAKLEPLKRRRAIALGQTTARMGKLTGPQIREAEMLLTKKGAD